MKIASPGEVLLFEFMHPMMLGISELAEETGIPEEHLVELIAQRRKIDLDMATRLTNFFGTAEGFWLELQGAYNGTRN